MNFMVFISHFCYLNFTSKLCTEPPWFLCTVVLYTFLGFQWYQVCNFWPGRLISMEFTSSAQNLVFENQSSKGFWPDWPGWLVCATWQRVIGLYRFGGIFYSQPLDLDQMDKAKQKRNCSPAGLTPARRSWRLSTARISAVLRQQGSSGRDAEHHGKVGDEVGSPIFFLERHGGSAGAASGGGVLRASSANLLRDTSQTYL
jgi:hypothetical protein